MTAAERKVRERYPDAACVKIRNGVAVETRLGGFKVLTAARTPDEAWTLAASRLPTEEEEST